jgi:hypothetical protein
LPVNAIKPSIFSRAVKTENPSLEGVKFSILAGLASGNPDVEFQSVMEFAEFTQKPIAQFRCEVQG